MSRCKCTNPRACRYCVREGISVDAYVHANPDGATTEQIAAALGYADDRLVRRTLARALAKMRKGMGVKDA